MLPSFRGHGPARPRAVVLRTFRNRQVNRGSTSTRRRDRPVRRTGHRAPPAGGGSHLRNVEAQLRTRRLLSVRSPESNLSPGTSAGEPAGTRRGPARGDSIASFFSRASGGHARVVGKNLGPPGRVGARSPRLPLAV